NVWSTTLGDAHRAARVLMMAIDKDPTQHTAAERLAQLYRDKGDVKALVALLDRRAKALAPLAQPKKAIDAYRKAMEIDPQSALAIYSLRELLKSQGQWDEALALYEAE